MVAGEREHAIALYMACKYLPPQLLASPGERKGMLIEASKLLEKIGDRKTLEACSKLMNKFPTFPQILADIFCLLQLCMIDVAQGGFVWSTNKTK